MFENKSYFKIKSGSEKNFGFTFAIFFLIIGLYPLLHYEVIRLWAIIIAIILFFLSIFLPTLLVLPNKLWFKIGMFLGSIVSPLIMAIIFFLIVTPTGIIMRLLKKDLLLKKIDKSKKSYWFERKETSDSMKNQF
jgi:type III secretory pathway component EscU